MANLGSLKFQIEADVSSLKKAEEEAAAVARAMELAAGKASRFDQALKLQAQHIASGRAGLVNLHSIVQQVDRGFSSATATINTAAAATSKMERAVSSTTAQLKQSAAAMATGAAAAKHISEQTKETASSASAAELMLLRLSKSVLSLSAAYAAWRVGRDVIQTGMDFQRLELSLKGIAGSSEGARREMTYIRDETKRLGMDLYFTADAYKLLAAASAGTFLEGQATRDIFNSVSEAATVLSLKAEQTSLVLYAVQQMMSKGVVSSEELRRQMGDQLPGAFQLAAKSMNMTQAEFHKMLEQGKIMSSEFLPKFAAALHERYGGSVADSAKSAQAQVNRFHTSVTELKNLIATGALPAFTSMIEGLTGVIETFTKAEEEGTKVLGVIKNIIALDGSRVGIDIDFQYVGKTPDEMIKEWNIGGSSSAFEGFLTKMKRRSQVWMAHLTQDPTGEKARQGIDVGHEYDWWQSGTQRQLEDQLRESQRSASVGVFEASRKSRFGAEQTGAAAELAKFQKIVDTVNIPKIDSIKEKIAALWEVQMKTPQGVEDFDLKLKNLNEQLAKETKPKGGSPMGYEKINQDLSQIMSAAAEAGKALQDLQYEYAILQKTGAGQLGSAEWLRTEKDILDQTFDAWKDIEAAQEKYRETQEKLGGAKGGGTQEAFLELAAAKKYLDEAWSKGVQRIDLISDVALEKFRQYNEQMRLAGQVELAQVNAQYVELTGNFRQVELAQQAVVEASFREKMANVNKDIPGLVEAYERLYDVQMKMAGGGSYIQGQANQLIGPGMDKARLMESYSSIYEELERMRQNDLEHEAVYQQAKAQLWMNTYGAQLDATAQFFTNLGAMMGEQSAAGKAMAVAAGTIQAILSSIKAYTAALDIPIIGPYVAPVFAAVAFAAQMSAVAKIKSAPAYAAGGRPRVGRPAIVGERGPEVFVPDSPGTVIPNHEAFTGWGGGGRNPNIIIENHGVNVEVDRFSEDDIRIIARREAKDAVRRDAPHVIASEYENPNSKVSKAQERNFNAPRRR